MSLLYVLGNLLGRTLVSYFIILIVIWLGSRLNWRLALKRSTRWYSLAGAVALGVLGVGAAVVRQGGIT